jgi:hypothetical protein
MEGVNRERIRAWREGKGKNRVFTEEEADFAFSGGNVDVGDSGSAVELSPRRKRKIDMMKGTQLREWPVKRYRRYS